MLSITHALFVLELYALKRLACLGSEYACALKFHKLFRSSHVQNAHLCVPLQIIFQASYTYTARTLIWRAK